jgi:hypothetical protein
VATAPGGVRSGVSVSVDGGPSGTTDANGVVVLADVEPGTRTISLSGSGLSGELSVSIADKDLREVAVALAAGGAEVMADVRYAFGGQVVEVTPSMSVPEVNDALAQRNTIVCFNAGTYTGDLVFSGSNVTLFGQGTQGGQVTPNGSIEVGGSANRIRGARMTSDLSVPGSHFGFSFSRVAGAFDLSGSNAVLLNNGFCGTITISGSGTTALGNAGDGARSGAGRRLLTQAEPARRGLAAHRLRWRAAPEVEQVVIDPGELFEKAPRSRRAF